MKEVYQIISTDGDGRDEMQMAMASGQMAACLGEIYNMLRRYTKYYDENTMPKDGCSMAEKIREEFHEITACLPEGVVS